MLKALAGGYSSGKVDVIGHSMGGLLARVYIQSLSYGNNIDRLITLNTPHSGSQIANFILRNEFSSLTLRLILNLAKKYTDFGAVNDLQTNSQAITSLRNGELSAPAVPKRAIVTSTSVFKGSGWDAFVINSIITLIGDNGTQQIFNFEKNDLIVPVSSQTGGLSEDYYTYNLTNVSHRQSTSDQDNIDAVTKLLNENPNNTIYFTTVPFNPPFLVYSSKALAKSEGIKTIDSNAVVIASPSNGMMITPNQTIDITILSNGSINKLLFAAATEQGHIVSNIIEDSSGIFPYTVPNNATGTITIIAVGSGNSGNVGIDSIRLNVMVSASLDSISIYPKQISLPKNQKANISIKGYYSDGITRDISNDPNINSISSDPAIVKMLSPISLSADSIGFADVNIAYFGKTDHLSITVLPANAFVTSIDQGNNEGIVKEYVLFQNYPNPFNPNTTLKYSIPRASVVRLKIYDMLGREVAVLVNEEKPAGNYSIKFNGSNLASGVYFYRLQAGVFVETKKLLLLR